MLIEIARQLLSIQNNVENCSLQNSNYRVCSLATSDAPLWKISRDVIGFL